MIHSNGQTQTKVLQAQHKALNIALARRHTLEFCQFTKPDFTTAPHHHILANIADDILYGRERFVIINLPPRHTKSEIFSIRVPGLFLGLFPDKQILHASHTAYLGHEFSRQVRDLVSIDPTYRQLFATSLSRTRARIDDWKTLQGGGMKVVGTGGALTGFGGDLIIVDDPVREGDEHSPIDLEKTFQWFTSAVMTRMNPGGRVVVIMTRWHVHDLTGRLMDDPDTAFRQISIPAIATSDDDLLGRATGEVLWPERVPIEELDRQRNLIPRYFASLYQQDPQPDTTTVFRERDFARHSTAHMNIDCVWAFDIAITESAQADWTSYGRWQMRGHDLYLTDLHRHQLQWPKTRELILELVHKHPHDRFLFPRHSYELLAVQDLKNAVGDQRYRIQQVDLPRNADKAARAAIFATFVASNRVFVETGEQGDHFIHEHATFPARHDDCVDQSSIASYYFVQRAAFDYSRGLGP